MMASPLTRKFERAVEHHRKKDLASAEALYRQVLAKDDGHVASLHLLSAILLETGRTAEAVKVLNRGIARAPTQAVFLANLGEAYRRLGQPADAEGALQRALALKPDLGEAHYTLGLVLCRTGRTEEAVTRLRRAASLKPDSADVHMGLAEAAAHDHLDEAIAACRRALELRPRSADAHNQLGFLLKEQGRIEEALASFRAAIECQPGHLPAHSNLVYSLPFDPATDDSSNLREARRWGEVNAPAAAATAPRHDNDRDPDRRLRVGYTSPDFRNHCQALFLLPLLEHRDRSAFEVVCYSWVKRPDEVTDRIRGLVDTFRDIAPLSDAEASEAIRADRIDVLVDLTMHMGDNRMPIFVPKPAPVQVAWLAYPGTTGLASMDYRITDGLLDPPDFDAAAAYSEESVRLPESFWCYDPLTTEPEPGPLPALRENRITFGCLNNFNKTGAPVFAVWAQVLRAVEGSRLLLLARPGESRTRVCEAFARAGVDPQRVEFVGYQPRAAYLAEYRRIDVCLDTFPVNGHTTSLDAHWMGVPVVTMVGPTVLGRAGVCYAHHLGLEKLVARTPDEYVAAAVELTRDRSHLSELRSELRGRMQRSALMDGSRFARDLEGAYRWMWRRWCRGPG